MESAAISNGRPTIFTGRSISDGGNAGSVSSTVTATGDGVIVVVVDGVGELVFFDGPQAENTTAAKRTTGTKRIVLIYFFLFFVLSITSSNPPEKNLSSVNCQNITPPNFLRNAYSVFNRIDVVSSKVAKIWSFALYL